MNIANSITDIIGNTPLIKLNAVSEATGNIILGKCEFMNPTHSVKDRLAKGVIEDAIATGKIVKGTIIVEPTSGNTGIGLAAICASLGIELILTMPSSMSVERRQLMQAMGAKIVLTEPSLGMKGSIDEANKILQDTPNAVMMYQFDNDANVQAHKNTTVPEIIRDTNNQVDFFVAGAGTSGTITGVGEGLKESNPNTQIVLVEPDKSPLIATGAAGPHKIQGIGPNFVPSILNRDIIDRFLTVSVEESIECSRTISKTEGLLVGISSGANVAATVKLANEYKNANKVFVTVLCDTGERYLSTGLYATDEA